jgi:gas vesicle protein
MTGNRGPGFFAGALMGGLVGAGLTALLMPRSGERIRDDLADWRAANRATGEPQDTAAGLLEAGAALVQASLRRLQMARDAARMASEDASRELWQEWSARLAGGTGELSEDQRQGR